MTLAAAFLALDEEFHHSIDDSNEYWPSTANKKTFEDAIVQHLVGLGVSSPLHGIKQGGVGDYLQQVASKFFKSRKGKCPAAVSVIGALASQEAIKGITGVHAPLQQMMFFESLESLLEDDVDEYIGDTNMCRVYGKQLSAALQNQRLFVVGAGAIGCELLKNFALMDVAVGRSADTCENERIGMWAEKGLSNGGIVVADMDTIEKSNLNRQLLFRPEHIGKSKAETAAAVLKKINNRVNVIGVDAKVSADSEIFDTDFWENSHIVVTALDNVDARRFVDSMCLKYKRCMLDSGTQGTKGNTQVVYPSLTESYSSSTDPSDDSIPLCTLKTFPYLAEHCVAWSKSLFDTIFGSDIAIMRNALHSVEEGTTLKFLESLNKDELKRLWGAFNLCSSEYSVNGAVRLAFDLFVDMFTLEVQALIATHPVDEIDEFGTPFWSGSRKFPSPVIFDPKSNEHISFVKEMATQLCRTYGIDASSVDRIVRNSKFRYSKQKESSLEEMRSQLVKSFASIEADTIKRILSSLQEQAFEKDDPDLGHVDLVALTANIRCRIYGIGTIDRMEVQRLAGKIIPALATTTAMVAGLVCLEMVKAVAALEGMRVPQLSTFRNSFVNLALPELSFAEPVAAEEFTVGSETFTPWDFIFAPSGSATLNIKSISKMLEKRFGVHLQSVAIDDRLLYADFLDDADDRFRAPINSLLVTEDEEGLENRDTVAAIFREKYVDLQIICVDNDGDEIRVPPIRVYLQEDSFRKRRLASSVAHHLQSKFRSFASRTKGSVRELLRWR